MDQSIIAWEGMSGVRWLGSIEADEVNASLHCDGNILYGQLKYQQRKFGLRAVAEGLRAEGLIESEGGETYPISVLLKGSEVELFFYSANRSAVQRSVLLQPQHRSIPTDIYEADTWMDKQLIGIWKKTGPQSNSGAGSKVRLMFYARGELYFSGNNDPAHPAFLLTDKRSDTKWYQWQTRSEVGERILFIQDHGQWLRYGCYLVEGNRMLITHSDGEQEFWIRQGE